MGQRAVSFIILKTDEVLPGVNRFTTNDNQIALCRLRFCANKGKLASLCNTLLVLSVYAAAMGSQKAGKL